MSKCLYIELYMRKRKAKVDDTCEIWRKSVHTLNEGERLGVSDQDARRYTQTPTDCNLLRETRSGDGGCRAQGGPGRGERDGVYAHGGMKSHPGAGGSEPSADPAAVGSGRGRVQWLHSRYWVPGASTVLPWRICHCYEGGCRPRAGGGRCI